MVRLSYFIALIIALLFSTQSFAQKEEIKEIVEKAHRSATKVFNEAKKTYSTHSFFDERTSSLTLSKSFNGETKTSSTTFSVEKDIRKIKFSLTGNCSEGEIIIAIFRPNGKIFKKVVINESADVSWSQNIIMKNKEEKPVAYHGEWTLRLTTSTAIGKYLLGVATY